MLLYYMERKGGSNKFKLCNIMHSSLYYELFDDFAQQGDFVQKTS